jgi:uncharacterized protein YndB with AHSA1/START domain
MQTKNDAININMNLDLKKEDAFEKFVYQFSNWWPKEYTWSGQKLKSINIMGEVNAKCYEIGPYDFRYDWGRILEIKSPHRIVFTWQISPARIPEPDPDKASEIEINLIADNNSTILQFVHRNFSKHGVGWEKYLESLKSEQGWTYILKKYKEFCETE